MKFHGVRQFFFVLLFTLTLAPGLYAQRVSRVAPSNVTLRAVSLSSLWTGMVVGDSGYISITHNALTAGTWTTEYFIFNRSVTLYAVAYAGDTSHAVIAGERGFLSNTTDGGTTWDSLFLGTRATIRALTWNKSATANVLVGVGDSGLVIRSTDQGQTWKIISSTTSAQLNAISFGTPNDAVAVGNDTSIIETHDAGQTWTPMVFPYSAQTLWHGRPDTAFKSIDFSAVAMTGTDSVWIALKNSRLPLLVCRGAIDTIADTGANAARADTAGGQNQGNTYTALIYAGMPAFMELFSLTSSDLIFCDTGRQFWQQLHANTVGDADGISEPSQMRFHGAAIWKEDTTVLILTAGEEFTGMIYVWTPNARNNKNQFGWWHTPTFTNSRGIVFLDVNILPNGYGYAVGTGIDLDRTTDSGRTWNSITVPIAAQANLFYSDSSFNTVYTLDTSTALVMGWNGLIYRVAPTGSGFIGVGLAAQERLEGIAFPSKDTGIIVGDFGTVLQSMDRGMTWRVSSGGSLTSELLYSVAFANANIGVAVGTNGTILRTTDGGNSWNIINNVLTDANIPVDYRQVQAFSDGTFFARAAGNLLRSTDFGQNWIILTGVDDTAGMSFFSTQIGMIAESVTSSALVPDTVQLAYTTDGGSTWNPFTVPIWNYNRIIFHWLSDHEVLLYGIDGFVVDVDISAPSGVRVTQISQTSDFSVYPNPSNGDVQVSYTSRSSGPVSIELYDESGRMLKRMFNGEEIEGNHVHTFDLSKVTPGSYFIRFTHDGKTSSSPVSVE